MAEMPWLDDHLYMPPPAPFLTTPLPSYSLPNLFPDYFKPIQPFQPFQLTQPIQPTQPTQPIQPTLTLNINMSDHGAPEDGPMGSGAGSPPPPQQASEHLNIKVTDGNNEVFFKIKRSTKLEKLMNAFCERQGKPASTVRFLFDGQRVQKHDSPDTLEMQDGDSLEVHQEQIGGS